MDKIMEKRICCVWAMYLPDHLNIEADQLSRDFPDNNEWSLYPHIFNQVVDFWGVPQIDIFASAINTNMPRFISTQNLSTDVNSSFPAPSNKRNVHPPEYLQARPSNMEVERKRLETLGCSFRLFQRQESPWQITYMLRFGKLCCLHSRERCRSYHCFSLPPFGVPPNWSGSGPKSRFP